VTQTSRTQTSPTQTDQIQTDQIQASRKLIGNHLADRTQTDRELIGSHPVDRALTDGDNSGLAKRRPLTRGLVGRGTGLLVVLGVVLVSGWYAGSGASAVVQIFQP
jgi:hypothetical protein